MKLFLIALLFITVSCAKRSGTAQGTLVTASKEGVFITSCELDVQYGEQSSRVEEFSSKDPGLCDDLADYTGKKVKIKYHFENFSFATNDGHIVDSVTVINK